MLLSDVGGQPVGSEGVTPIAEQPRRIVTRETEKFEAMSNLLDSQIQTLRMQQQQA